MEEDRLRGCLFFFFFITHHSSLNFHHSSLITHQLKIKIPKFPKPHPFDTLTQTHFSTSKTDPFLKLKSKVAVGFHKKKNSQFVKHCGWVCEFNYENAIITLFP